MTTSEILSFTEKPIIDESIQEYEYHEYEPLPVGGPFVEHPLVSS